jgi:hypothetical protein
MAITIKSLVLSKLQLDYNHLARSHLVVLYKTPSICITVQERIIPINIERTGDLPSVKKYTFLRELSVLVDV